MLLVDDEMAVDYAGDLKDRVRPIHAAPEGYVWDGFWQGPW